MKAYNKNNFKYLFLFIFIIISFIFCYSIYILLDYLSATGLVFLDDIFLLIVLIIGLLMVIISILSTKVMVKSQKDKKYISELKNFKDYTDALNLVSTEVEIYYTLYNALKDLPQVAYTTIYYRDESCTSDIMWKKIGVEEVPLCELSTRKCPLIKTEKECLVESIKNCLTCANQLPFYKNGSYLCLLLSNEVNSKTILQIYSKSEYAFDITTMSKIKSYVEIGKAFLSSKRQLSFLNQAASTDKLTNLSNRGSIEKLLDENIAIAISSKQPLSVIMADIDHFKKVNDTYGHNAGDYVLVLFSQIISNCIRKTDIAGRYGGEEFLILLPATEQKTAEIIAERIRVVISETSIPPIDGTFIPSITCSLGVSTYPILCDSKDSLKKTSDIALYKAKQSGRNCTVIYNEGMKSITS